MQRNEVRIAKRENGSIERRLGYNVWTGFGRAHLARLVAEGGPDERPRFLRLGVGGRHSQPLSSVGELGDAYPVGEDPLATDGRSYDARFPVEISTLERPVRVSGSAAAYPGSPGDVWATSAKMLALDLDSLSLTYLFRLSGAQGDLSYAPFSFVPLTEVGLALADTDVEAPYEPVVAYFGFPAITVTPLTEELTIEWRVRF